MNQTLLISTVLCHSIADTASLGKWFINQTCYNQLDICNLTCYNVSDQKTINNTNYAIHQSLACHCLESDGKINLEILIFQNFSISII